MSILSTNQPGIDDGAPKHLKITRRFATEGVHPYDQIEWDRRDIVQKNWSTGDVVFEQHGVEFPTTWSETAATIVTTKYFRGAHGTDAREHSLRQVIDRVVDRYHRAALDFGYTDEAGAQALADDLTWLLVNQHFSFNSPVWFNVGTTSPQQVSACFILSVDDSMDSILNWYKEEGFIFKGGSGAGLNISRIRSSKELLASSGGNASGPVSFMRGADASAGTIKSGGATRRAAKMVVLDVDHPDIEEFIETKAREENKIRALRDAGFDMDLGGRDITSVQYQNANNSVRVSDEFMRAVEEGTDFGLRARTTGEVVESVDARELWHKIAVAAWECADPGLQYDDTINDWHTLAATGRINASNPCSEYMSIDNSSCNLASLNLLRFLDQDGTFDSARFTEAVEVVITAMEISISFADFPTEAIDLNTRRYRQLGIGFANLGALLMRKGVAYDSPEGRALAAAITSLMTGVSYRRSAEIAGVVGPYEGYEENAGPHTRVMHKHHGAARDLVRALTGDAIFVTEDMVTEDGLAETRDIAELAEAFWADNLEIGKVNGWRNAQASVLAPTGTIGFMMDCDTTGVEPDFSLVKFKKMVGGASMQIVNQQVAPALRTLGYTEEQIAEIEAHILDTNGDVEGAPGLAPAHYAVFDCAAGPTRQIAPGGHLKMMAACQPFLSGAISKTVNLPETATVEEIADIYFDSWKLGLKATAVYRDNCKVGQPLSSSKKADASTDTGTDTSSDASTGASAEAEPQVHVVEKIVEKIVEVPRRERMPRRRKATVTSFRVGESDGYLTTGEFADGRLGEIFLKMSKQGSTMAGMMDAFSVAVSIGLQYGVPLETYVSKFTNQRFEPAGVTDDADIRMAQSIVDYLFRRLAIDHLTFEERSVYGIYTNAERQRALDNGGVYEEIVETAEVAQDEIGSEPAPEPEVANRVPETTDDTAATDEPGSATESTGGPRVELLGLPGSVAPADDLLEARALAYREAAPMCTTCGTNSQMSRSGSCWACRGCGSTTGCS